MKIGRNEPCPCGSGKKFKKCCIDKSENNIRNHANSMTVSAANPFFKKYNTASLLQAFAGLSIIPENHGKYVRLEEAARLAIQNYNQNRETPPASVLKTFLDTEYSFHISEDPSVNLFTDLITFHGGDYLVLPGITEGGTFTLRNLLIAIFQWTDSGIPIQFSSNCMHVATLLLALSDVISKRLGYSRYQKEQ